MAKYNLYSYYFLKGFQPVGIWNDFLILYKAGSLYLLEPNTQRMFFYVRVSSSIKERILGQVSWFARFLRLRVRAHFIDRLGVLYLYLDNMLLEFCLETKKIINKTKVRSRPLYIVEICNIHGFDDSVIFGEYCVNPAKGPVNIYKKTKSGQWKVVYAFPSGAINHIHNIIPDRSQNCLWILTGDFGNSSAIWRVEDNFKKVTPVVAGKQQFRTCMAFPTKCGLLYATDTPFFQNSIRLLYKNKEGIWLSRHIQDINGTCIYACRYNGDIYFATTVEANGTEKSKLKFLLTTKRGDGIKDNKSYLYKQSGKKFEIVYSSEKDKLPFILFQFGSLKFPSVDFEFDYLPVYHVASKKYDLSTLLLKI